MFVQRHVLAWCGGLYVEFCIELFRKIFQKLLSHPLICEMLGSPLVVEFSLWFFPVQHPIGDVVRVVSV